MHEQALKAMASSYPNEKQKLLILNRNCWKYIIEDEKKQKLQTIGTIIVVSAMGDELKL